MIRRPLPTRATGSSCARATRLSERLGCRGNDRQQPSHPDGPVARNADGSSIVGPSLEEFVIDNSATTTGFLSYTAASLDKSLASLSVREHYADPPTPIPASDWGYVNSSGNAIRLLPVGTPFQQGRLYEFTYPAKDPLVVGLGFAATRDVAAFLRYAAADDEGNPNPLAEDAQSVYTFCFSLPCRFLHDFLRLGFNEDEQGRRAFDAMLNWVGGGSGGFFNYRFAQPSRTHRQHIGRWYPERQFPFANQVTFDPVTGTTEGVLRRCLATSTCPKILEANSANEYWVKAGSLLHTDTLGNDVLDPPNVRSTCSRACRIAPRTGPAICQQPRNPLVPNAGLRALQVALDQWATSGTEPPASRVRRRLDGTSAPTLRQSALGFPHIPGVKYNALMTTGDLFDFWPSSGDGILTILPPIHLGTPYPAFAPKTDADWNDVAGIRLPEIAVPLATYTGWGLRAASSARGDLCDAAGQKIASLERWPSGRGWGAPALDRGKISVPRNLRERGRASGQRPPSAASVALRRCRTRRKGGGRREHRKEARVAQRPHCSGGL